LLYRYHAVLQFFIDLFWQRQNFSSALADLPTVHRGVHRFGITTRLAHALAKQAKEILRSPRKKHHQRKPRRRRPTVTLFYPFVKIEAFQGAHFDWAVCLIGSGAPRVVLPVHSTRLIKRRLQAGLDAGENRSSGNGRSAPVARFPVRERTPGPP
jgi:hypothetical protein